MGTHTDDDIDDNEDDGYGYSGYDDIDDNDDDGYDDNDDVDDDDDDKDDDVDDSDDDVDNDGDDGCYGPSFSSGWGGWANLTATPASTSTIWNKVFENHFFEKGIGGNMVIESL